MQTRDLIWILDTEPACLQLYEQTLGIHYEIENFSSTDTLLKALSEREAPRLLIADPQNTQGSLASLFKRSKENGQPPLKLPDYLIASRLDDLEMIRFYLSAGAHEYLLKPLRAGELIAKVERVLFRLTNQEVQVLRNDFDGVQIPNLTLREHQLLTVFLSRNNRSVTRDELFGTIWNKVTVNRKTLDVHLFNLRQKLRPHGYDIICRNHEFSLGRHERVSAT